MLKVQRVYTIIKVLLTYGLDELIPDSSKPWYFKWLRNAFAWLPNRHKHKSQAVRIRLALEELGPVWVKLGQMLSTRRDLLPVAIANELAKLQDKVKPFKGDIAKSVIETELGIESIDQVFTDFDVVPLASASIAQVHTATLKADADNEERDVVIKVIRPGIEKDIKADSEVMNAAAALVARFLPDGKRLRPREVVEDYQKTIFAELDLSLEAGNAIQLRGNFENSDSLYVPEVHTEFCTRKVMVMERIYGIPVGDVDALKAHGVNMEKLAERGVQVFFTQVFRDSFFHADMHPGNIFVSFEHPENPKYIGIDCGIVGSLNSQDKRYLAENFIAFFNRDYRKVAQLHVDSGWIPSDTNVDEFEGAIRTVCDPIFQKPLAEISFGHVLFNLFSIARRFNMQVQPQLVLLQKTLLYIEGLGRTLYPELDLWKTAKPFLEDWLSEQIGVKRLFKQIKSEFPFWAEKFPEMPDLVYAALRNQQQPVVRQTITHTPSSGKIIFGSVVGATSAVCTTLLHLQHESFAAGIGLGVTVIAWFITYQQLKNH